MMNKEQAKKIADKLVPGCTVTDIEDYDELFAVHFVNDEYYKSGNFTDMAIGAGPIFIEKATSKTFKTSSGICPSDCVAAYRACGDIYASLSNIIEIFGLKKGVEKAKLILIIKKTCDIDLKFARTIVCRAELEKPTEVKLLSADEAETILRYLCKNGVQGRQLWSSSC